MKNLWSAAVILVTFYGLLIDMTVAQGRKRTRTTTSTTEAPMTNLEETLADREAALQLREENQKEREENFKIREETLAAREAAFRGREDKLSTREQNLVLREQNTLRGSCSNKLEESTPPPDYSLVRFDETSLKYLEIGSTKYCSQNMRFFASPDNETSGACDCDYHECARPLLYSDKYKQCFWAWSQGPCEQKEWYVFDDDYNPVCKPNPCPESEALAISNYYFLNPTDGECYKAGSKGFCTKRGETLLTAPDAPIPSCRRQTVCYPLSIPATQECVPGNKRYYDGGCDIE